MTRWWPYVFLVALAALGFAYGVVTAPLHHFDPHGNRLVVRP